MNVDNAKSQMRKGMEKPLYFDPFGQTEFTHLGHNMIDPLKSWC